MRNATLTFLLRDEQVNLPRKKRGFGINRHNGYGGKQHDGESVEEAVIRELIEESSIYAEKSDLIKCAELEFTFPEKPAEMELVRLAFPRRVYTQSHADYLIEVMEHIVKQKQKLKGYRITYQEAVMRHFTAHFEPLEASSVSATPPRKKAGRV